MNKQRGAQSLYGENSNGDERKTKICPFLGFWKQEKPVMTGRRVDEDKNTCKWHKQIMRISTEWCDWEDTAWAMGGALGGWSHLSLSFLPTYTKWGHWRTAFVNREILCSYEPHSTSFVGWWPLPHFASGCITPCFHSWLLGLVQVTARTLHISVQPGQCSKPRGSFPQKRMVLGLGN